MGQLSLPTTLPDAAWRHRTGLDRLCAVLGANEGRVRFVGGAVRDTLLGIGVADVDLATVHAPGRVMALLKDNGIKVVPTGLAHGTITAVLPDGPIEVTTLRCDVETDGRRATVAFTGDWREDAARRDFTMNALYADPLSGEIYDYFGGLDDLQAGVVRFIGDPLQRIAEDHLRILRFFRFHARFGDTIDAAGLEACATRANDLMALSRERIAAELLRLLVARHAVDVVTLMIDKGIFTPVLPEIGALPRFTSTTAREAATDTAPSAIRRLVALLPAAAVDDVGARLKLSNADRKRMAIAAQPLLTEEPFALRYRLGAIGAVDQLLLSDLPDGAVAARLAAIRDWESPRLPLTGGALVEAGVRKGPDVARLLREVEEQWIAEGFPDAARVAQLAAEAVEGWRLSTRN
ncbi:MAG: polynucleotide adenylyltransferase [Sphingomonas bacterium]|uniref:CCA tRNA nucleotidyltransferase n=1 Tax=Sphingomonas bacterium TaxID=1895847 RepID=UPI0026155C1D|nr:CCA tRNA nucleotidyltransferase [Sphingomonas bacterium]MDB5709026.1 polynucleotide adenylyltransferase [Sphingomonas bacterium]